MRRELVSFVMFFIHLSYFIQQVVNMRHHQRQLRFMACKLDAASGEMRMMVSMNEVCVFFPFYHQVSTMLAGACVVLKNLSSMQDPVQVYSTFAEFNKQMEDHFIAQEWNALFYFQPSNLESSHGIRRPCPGSCLADLVWFSCRRRLTSCLKRLKWSMRRISRSRTFR